jgi:hypothetical protein
MDIHYRTFRQALAAALLGIVLAGAALAQTTVEVIPLKYRQADQVIPVLQPLLGRDASISNFQNQLVIRATPAELAQVKNVLASLDTPPRRLLITVRQDADVTGTRREAEVSGSIGNDQARVTVPGSGSREGGNVVLRDGDDRLRARVVDSSQAGSERTAQTVQVLEGYSAFIRAGESRPRRKWSAPWAGRRRRRASGQRAPTWAVCRRSTRLSAAPCSGTSTI